MALAGELARYIGNEFVPMATKTAGSALSSVLPSAITKTGTSLATKAGEGLLNNILVNKIKQTASNYVPVVVNGKISLKNLPGYSEGNNLNLRHISNKEPSDLGVSDLSHQHGGTFFASKKGSKIPVVNGENVYFGNLDNAKVLDLSDSDTALALSKGYKYNLGKTGAFKDSAYPESEITNQVMQIQKGKTGSINRGDVIDNLTGGDIVLKGSSDVPTEVAPEFVLTNNDMVKKANFSLGYKRPQGDSISRAKQYINSAKYGLDEYGMGNIDLRDLNTPKVKQYLELSPEQQEVFKDSVIRDNSGMLKKMYHGSPNGQIKEFNPGSYFTENKEYADGYQNPEASSLMPGARKIKNTPKTYEVYLNIKKPFTLSDARAKDIYFNEYIKGGNSAYYDPYGTTRKMIDDLDEVDWTEGVNLMEWLQENHPEYDGMYLDEGGAGGYSPDNEYVDRGKSVVNFRGDQVKILN